ncbi:MAG TPA: hypothetical protein VHN20_10685 [Beijerinckiaceae bacterium]|nr:hypothetical protein [Beijerinckiaceae bacterium]
MRLPIATGIIVLVAGLLQACQSAQSGKTSTEIASAQAAQPSAAPVQIQHTSRLREQARAYAERLNQGRCAAGAEAASFDATSNALEKDLPALKAGEAAVMGASDARLAGEVERALAEARLDIGDAARTGGCADIANVQYRMVLRSFPGAAHAGYRRRAEMGLSGLQL